MTTAANLSLAPPFVPAPVPCGALATQLARIFVIDDDPLFARSLRRLGRERGIVVDCFDPDVDFPRLPRDGDYDAGVVDFNLGTLRGTQLASLYRETPVLLVSIQARTEPFAATWPPSVRGFMPKRRGAAAILDAAVAVTFAFEPETF